MRDDFSKVHLSNSGMRLQALRPLQICACKSPMDLCDGEFQKVKEAKCSLEAFR